MRCVSRLVIINVFSRSLADCYEMSCCRKVSAPKTPGSKMFPKLSTKRLAVEIFAVRYLL